MSSATDDWVGAFVGGCGLVSTTRGSAFSGSKNVSSEATDSFEPLQPVRSIRSMLTMAMSAGIALFDMGRPAIGYSMTGVFFIVTKYRKNPAKPPTMTTVVILSSVVGFSPATGGGRGNQAGGR